MKVIIHNNIRLFEFISLLFLLVNSNKSYCQTNPSWSTQFDYLDRAYVKAVSQTGNGNLYILGQEKQLGGQVNLGSFVKLFNRNTTQIRAENDNIDYYTFESIIDMKLIGDSVLYIAGSLSNTFSEKYAVYKKNVLSSNWQQLCKTHHSINCLEVYNNKLYLGGAFDSINGVYYNKIATYDPITNTFDSLSGKLILGDLTNPPIVNCMTTNKNGLIIGGRFLRAGNVQLSSIALYNTSGWHSLNNGLGYAQGTGTFIPVGTVSVVTIDPTDSMGVTVGGGFNYFNNTDFQYAYNSGQSMVAKWNNFLNQWDTIPYFKLAQNYQVTNAPTTVLSDLRYYNNELYLSYVILFPDKTRILKISSNNWSVLPLKFEDDSYDGCSFDLYDGDLLISSNHTYPIKGTIRYNSNGTYRSFGLGMSSSIIPNAFEKEGNEVYMAHDYGAASSHFLSASNMASMQIMKYNLVTMQYDSIQSNLSTSASDPNSIIKRLYSKGDSLIVLGYFKQNNFNNSLPLLNAAIYRKATKQWQKLINTTYTVTSNSSGNNYFKDIVFYGNGFFIGGAFKINNNLNLQNLVYWDGANFDSLKFMPHTGNINSLKITNDTLWVGGNFTGNMSKNFAAYKITTKQWLPTISLFNTSGISGGDAEVNKIDVYKNKIFIAAKDIQKTTLLGSFTYTIMPDSAASCGYINRNNLTQFIPFTDFKKFSNYNIDNHYIKNDSIIYFMQSSIAGAVFASSKCTYGSTNCDSTRGILEYNYITNKFKGYFEHGIRATDGGGVYFMAEFNNQNILFGSFKKVGYNTNASNIVVLNNVDNTITSVNKNEYRRYVNSVILFPNPTSKSVSIESNNRIKNIEIYDYTGKLILSTNQTTINIEHLSIGIYFLKALDEFDLIYTNKLLITR